MDADAVGRITAELLPAFPTIRIDHRGMTFPTRSNSWRVEDEFKAADMVGLTWVEVTSAQARGTVEVLDHIDPVSAPALLPAYLKFLADPDEADTLMYSVPACLLRLAERSQAGNLPFDRAQIASIVKVLTDALATVDPEDEGMWLPFKEAIRVYQDADRSGRFESANGVT